MKMSEKKEKSIVVYPFPEEEATPNHHLKKCVVFLHIPKTAGTSLISLLSRSFDRDKIYRFNSGDLQITFGTPDTYKNHDLVIGHVPVNFLSDFKESITLLTFLRHPVDRIISLYNFYKHLPENRIHGDMATFKCNAANKLSIREYCNLDHPYVINETNNGMSRMLSSRSGYGKDLSNEELFEDARDNLVSMKFGIVEDYEKSVDYIMHSLGLAPSLSIPKLNRTSSRPKLNEISIDDYETIINRNLVDMALYKFAVDEFNKRYEDYQIFKHVRLVKNSPLPEFRHTMGKKENVTQHKEDVTEFIEKTSEIVTSTFYQWTADQPITGTNWYDPELDSRGHIFRWSGPGKKSCLWFNNPLKNRKIKISIFISQFCDNRYSTIDFTILVNGKEYPMHSWWNNEDGLIYEFILDENAPKNDFMKFEFSVGFTLNGLLMKSDGSELRELGFGLYKITLGEEG